MNLLLVARSEAELARLARELQTDGSKTAVAAVADKLMTSVADYREATRAYPACHDNSQPA